MAVFMMNFQSSFYTKPALDGCFFNFNLILTPSRRHKRPKMAIIN